MFSRFGDILGTKTPLSPTIEGTIKQMAVDN
jgi:hypothetical protein